MGANTEAPAPVEAQDEVPEYAEILRRAAESPRNFPIPRRVSRKNLEHAFLTSFELIGGVPRLALWADQNPGQFYALASKLFPQQVVGKIGVDESLAKILSQMGSPAPAVGTTHENVSDAVVVSETQGRGSSMVERSPLLEKDTGSSPAPCSTEQPDTMVHTRVSA